MEWLLVAAVGVWLVLGMPMPERPSRELERVNQDRPTVDWQQVEGEIEREIEGQDVEAAPEREAEPGD